MSLIPSNKNNPCPICDGTSGKCRQGREDENYWQCMTYADARKGEIHNGFKCIGHTKDRQWGQFKLDNSQEWSEQQRLEWQRENQRRRNEKAKTDDERRRRSLAATERHEQYTRLLGELTLHQHDKADLIRRGFTHQQIELSGFRSIQRYQQLQSRYSDLLPGISRGERLIIPDEGYLCPVRNADGLIVACQVRLRTLPTTETNRYRWLNGGGQTLHLYPEGCKGEGELPLAIHLPQKLNKFAIGICEGTGSKPFLASQRLGIPFIGAAGGQHASSPELFKSSLQQIEEALWQIAQENGLSSIGKPHSTNQKESPSSANKGKQSKTEQKYQPQSSNTGIEQAHSVTKSQSSYSTSNSSQWLRKKLLDSLLTTLNSTDSICNPLEILSYQPAESESQSPLLELIITPDAGDILNPSVMHRWRRVAELLQEWGRSVKFAWWDQKTKNDNDIDEIDPQELSRISIKYLTPQEFLSLPAKIQKEEEERRERERENAIYKQLTGITEQPWLRVNQENIDLKSLNLPGHAIYIVLSRKGTGKTKATILLVKEDFEAVLAWFNRVALGREACSKLGLDWRTDKPVNKGYKRGFCSDSAYLFPASTLSKSGLLLVDEADQVFDHNFGQTCNKDGHRPMILSSLEEHLETAIFNGGMGLFMSADITQKEIDYIRALAPAGTPVRLIVNDYRPPKGDLYFSHADKPDGQIDILLKMLEEGRPCFVIDDIKNGVRGCKSIAEYIRTVHPEWEKRIVEINSDTSGSEENILYLQNINKLSKSQDTLLLCCSPSVTSGVSIENGHFQAVFGFFNGILTVKEACQAIERVRGDKLISVWAAEEGLAWEANRAIDPKEIKDYYLRNYTQNAKYLRSFDASYNPITGEWASPHFELYCKNAAYRNLCIKRLRERLRDRLEEEGYAILDCDDAGSDAVASGLKQSWSKVELDEAFAIAQAPILSDEEYKKLANTSNPLTPEQKDSMRKTYLKKTFGEKLIEVTTFEHKESEQTLTGYAAMHLKNERDIYHKQLESLRLLLADPSEAIVSDLATEQRQLKHGEGRFPGDAKWRTRQRKAREFLSLQKFLDPEKWWEPLDFKDLAAKAKRLSSHIKDAINLSVEKLSASQIFTELMEQLGLELEKQWVEGKTTADSKRHRWKRRRITEESWKHAQMYIEHQNFLRYAEYVATELIQPTDALLNEGCVSVSANPQWITPPSISIESHRGGDPKSISESGFITGVELPVTVNEVSQDEGEANGMSAGELSHSLATNSAENLPTSLEVLIEALAAVKTQQEFWSFIRGHEEEEIEDALLLQNLDQRSQLRDWYKAGDVGIQSVVDTQPVPKVIPMIPKRLRKVAAGVVAATVIAISGLPAAAAPVTPQNPVTPNVTESFKPVQPQEYHWDELPKPGTIVQWVDRDCEERLVLKDIEPDGSCQVKSLLSGIITNTCVSQLKPANSG